MANQRAQITMSDDEVREMIEQSRTMTMCTIGKSGLPHLVAMWYGVLNDAIYFETKLKSQKAQNLLRDPRIVCMVEDGLTYDQLRGVSIEGTATIIADTDDPEYWAAAVSVYERYNGEFTDEADPIVKIMMHKRVVVRVDATRVRSWDHRKLGLPALPVAGTTAAYL